MKTQGRAKSTNVKDERAYFGTDSITKVNPMNFQSVYDQTFQQGPLPAYKTPTQFEPTDSIGDIIKANK